jgi:guanylate kinase
MASEGMLIIVSAPSGTGKGAIIKRLTGGDNNIKYSVSATTRKPRAGETDGENYHFMNKEQFEDMITQKQLVEWDQYCGNYYGTPKKYIDEMTEKGTDVILEITVAGGVDVKKMYPDAVMIFVLPPSISELRRRITNRGTETPEDIENRLEKAYKELDYMKYYDYVVINDDLEKAVGQIREIINAERLKYFRNMDILNKIR